MKNTKPLYLYWVLQVVCVGFVPLNNIVFRKIIGITARSFDISMRIVYENLSGLVWGCCIFLLISTYKKLTSAATVKASVVAAIACGVFLVFFACIHVASFQACFLLAVELCLLAHAGLRKTL